VTIIVTCSELTNLHHLIIDREDPNGRQALQAHINTRVMEVTWLSLVAAKTLHLVLQPTWLG
jgi:hypothetical protein